MKKRGWRNEKIRNDDDSDDKLYINKPSFIESVSNRIYFYSDIDPSSVLQLNRQLADMQNRLIEEQVCRQSEKPEKIFLNINSGGGHIMDGFSASDEIRGMKVPVWSVVDGCCASAATLISVVCARRLMKKRSFMMIHQLSSTFWGTFENFKDETLGLEKMMAAIQSVYREHTKIPDDVMGALLKRDLWLTADECLSYGLIDEII